MVQRSANVAPRPIETVSVGPIIWGVTITSLVWKSGLITGETSVVGRTRPAAVHILSHVSAKVAPVCREGSSTKPNRAATAAIATVRPTRR